VSSFRTPATSGLTALWEAPRPACSIPVRYGAISEAVAGSLPLLWRRLATEQSLQAGRSFSVRNRLHETVRIAEGPASRLTSRFPRVHFGNIYQPTRGPASPPPCPSAHGDRDLQKDLPRSTIKKQAFPMAGRSQFSEGLSTWSMTRTSTGPLPGSSLRPSCCGRAAKIGGARGSVGGGSALSAPPRP